MAAEESVKALENSMSSTQQEIDLVVNAVKQLNSQKTEAQKRLDDLDAKVGRCFCRSSVKLKIWNLMKPNRMHWFFKLLLSLHQCHCIHCSMSNYTLMHSSKHQNITKNNWYKRNTNVVVDTVTAATNASAETSGGQGFAGNGGATRTNAEKGLDFHFVSCLFFSFPTQLRVSIEELRINAEGFSLSFPKWIYLPLFSRKTSNDLSNCRKLDFVAICCFSFRKFLFSFLRVYFLFCSSRVFVCNDSSKLPCLLQSMQWFQMSH